MDEKTKDINYEEAKKLFDEMNKDQEAFSKDSGWIYWVMLLLIFFAFPLGSNDSMHYDKQTIAYQQGKIDAYEKMMEG